MPGLGLVAGLAGHQLSKMNVDERELDRVQAIITSMTPWKMPDLGVLMRQRESLPAAGGGRPWSGRRTSKAAG